MPTYPSQDLYSEQICNTYQRILQIYNSNLLLNGSGSQIQSLDITASYVTNSPPATPQITTVTYSQASSSLSAKTLTENGYYRITDADSANALYGGNEIILRAATSASFDKRGVGQFFNPKYNQSVAGYGIWSEYMFFQAYAFEGLYTINSENVTGDGGQTAYIPGGLTGIQDYWQPLYMAIPTGGDWTTATSLTGSWTQAKIENITVPSYAIGDKVIWGGKVWENLTGAVGSATDIFNLDGTNWSVVTYNNTDYDIVWDEIEYDIVNNFITMRRDRANNIVKQTYDEWFNVVDDFRAIRLFPWGNDTKVAGKGLANNSIDGTSYVDLINFKGIQARDNVFKNLSVIRGNTIERGFEFSRNEFDYSKFRYNTFNGGGDASSAFTENKLHDSTFDSNIGTGDAYVYYNHMKDSNINTNTLAEGYVHSNKFDKCTSQNNRAMWGAGLYENVISNNCLVNSNILTQGYIYRNILNPTSKIIDNQISASYDGIYSNVLNNFSRIDNCDVFNNASIYQNVLNNTSFITANITGGANSIYDNALFNNKSITSGPSSSYFLSN